jgi:hypothetical protein
VPRLRSYKHNVVIALSDVNTEHLWAKSEVKECYWEEIKDSRLHKW